MKLTNVFISDDSNHMDLRLEMEGAFELDFFREKGLTTHSADEPHPPGVNPYIDAVVRRVDYPATVHFDGYRRVFVDIDFSKPHRYELEVIPTPKGEPK